MTSRLASSQYLKWVSGIMVAIAAVGCHWLDRVAPLQDSAELVIAIRVSPISYSVDADEHSQAFEQALLEKLAAHLGKTPRFIPLRSEKEVIAHVLDNRAHLGAGWLSLPEDPRLMATPPFHIDETVLIQNENSLPLETLDQLSGQTIHLPAGSNSVAILNHLRQHKVPNLTVIERQDGSGVGVMEAVAEQQIELTAAPRQQYLIAQNYFPELQSSLVLPPRLPIAWLMRDDDKPVPENIRAFLTMIEADGSLHRLKDAHLSFRNRLTRLDAIDFIVRIATHLPDYQALFKDAQIRTGIDWRLLAALSYQESQWDPLATSPTGVRGMMMLTEDTADRMKVGNRLDPAQSIHAGARYLAILRDELPPAVQEPDRTWLAIAAYNIGMGHMNGARAIAKSRNANPNDWYEMKKILPLLSRPEIYERLKSGRARGGEAVIMVENIRAYYDILSRHQPPYEALPNEAENETLRTLRASRPQASAR